MWHEVVRPILAENELFRSCSRSRSRSRFRFCSRSRSDIVSATFSKLKMDGGLVTHRVTHQNDRALKSGTNSLMTCLLSVLVLAENGLLVTLHIF